MPKKPVGNTVKIDFTGVEANSFEVPDGTYALRSSVVTMKKSQESGQPYLSWEWKVRDGKYKNRKIWDNTSLQPQALWKLRNLLECMDMEVGDGEFEIDLTELEGLEVGAEIANEKYQGKERPKVAGYMHVSEVEEDEEEAEAEPEAKEEPEPEPEPEPEVEKETPLPKTTIRKKKTTELGEGMMVSFEDEGKTFKGKITSVGEDTVEVKVGKDIWELEKSEVTPA